ncbi:unnamed protein product (mitochondrion) [Plasmodiophora brassicae]|uniref:Mre11 DNA-binding domain-containing protein n=1 Tax=Plasmodiophora brassicae TaxID=37360 RepID=A0A3P3YMT4_PLABS|nr:unnamed protein product [Plasmodiophora brassicae]
MTGAAGLHIPPDEDTFRILIATDNHLGCNERDPIRGDDAMRTFEEILIIAKSSNVDFVLLGGDLFHHNKPTRQTLFNTMQILRKHCLGDRPVAFQMLSDPATVFHERSCCNFEDPNINVSLPIFAIHGNHDDPSGYGGHAALDILDSASLLNYFGRVDDISEFCVRPILLRKGSTRLALYGLGSIRDERLHRALVGKKVAWARPNQDTNEWYNMLVLHQNRTQHSVVYKNSIPESLLPNFLDLVVWAHEHECRIELERSLQGNFLVTQPGSSAATSLCTAEAVKKHVGILEVRGSDVRLQPIPLTTPRPFIIEDVVLSEYAADLGGRTDSAAVQAFLRERVHKCIRRAEIESPRPPAITHSSQWLPLIRLRVDVTGGYATVNVQQFGQEFVDKVANPDDIIQIVRRKAANPTGSTRSRSSANPLVMYEIDAEGRESRTRIEDLVRVHLQDDNRDSLGVCHELQLCDALVQFVDKGDNQAIEAYAIGRVQALQKELKRDESVTIANVSDQARTRMAAYRQHVEQDNGPGCGP